MSHINAPRGLTWKKSLHGNKKPPMIDVVVPASTTLYTGSLLVADTSGVVALCGATTLGTNCFILGVCTGYLPSQTAAVHFQVINPVDQIFEIQAQGSTSVLDTYAHLYTAMNSANRYGFASGNAGVSGLNVSAMYLNLAAPGTTDGTNIFQLYSIPERPDNPVEATDYPKVQVKINNENISFSLVQAHA